jgi:hypothetical protein
VESEKINIGKFHFRKQILIFLIVLIVVGSGIPFLVQACVETGSSYQLSLDATQHYSDFILTAHLTISQEQHEKGHTCYEQENVAGATIYFYTCNSRGCDLKQIGYNVTGKDGTTTWYWSATHNGDYWFIATYTVSDK